MPANRFPLRKATAVALAAAAGLFALLGLAHDHDLIDLPVPGEVSADDAGRVAGVSDCTACRLSHEQVQLPQASQRSAVLFDDGQTASPSPVTAPRLLFFDPLSPRAPPAHTV